MLYRIRFQWGWTVQAESQQEAFAKAVKMVAAMPEGFITGVEDATLAKPKSLFYRLLTGK